MLNDLEVSSSNLELYNVGLLVISIAQSFYIQISIIGWTYIPPSLNMLLMSNLNCCNYLKIHHFK
jgi:hypothetical protein